MKRNPKSGSKIPFQPLAHRFPRAVTATFESRSITFSSRARRHPSWEGKEKGGRGKAEETINNWREEFLIFDRWWGAACRGATWRANYPWQLSSSSSSRSSSVGSWSTRSLTLSFTVVETTPYWRGLYLSRSQGPASKEWLRWYWFGPRDVTRPNGGRDPPSCLASPRCLHATSLRRPSHHHLSNHPWRDRSRGRGLSRSLARGPAPRMPR